MLLNRHHWSLNTVIQALTWLSSHALTLLLFVYAAAVFLSFGSESFELRFVPAAGLGFGMLAFIYRLSKREFTRGEPARQFSWHIPLALIGIGLFLRLAFGLSVHPVPASDMASYDFTARHLLSTGEYICRERGFDLHAYRPPGVAFLLAGTMAVVGQQWWAALVLNCVLYTLASFLLWKSLRGLALTSTALVIGMFVLWPSDIAAASLPQSETPSVLVSAALLYVLTCATGQWMRTVALGLITGFSCLMRNSNLLMIGVWLFVLAQTPVRVGQRLVMAVLLVGCAFAPIIPWTIRNHHVLGQTVLVATNGGDNLYTSNNPQTRGGWDGTAAARLRTYLPDEIAMDKAGFQLAKAWVTSHPAAFLKLSFQKVRILFGSDGWGPYWALERGRGYTGWWYQFTLFLAAIWWLVLWSGVLFGIVKHPHALRIDLTLTAVAAFTLLPAMLFFVFQSQARYHAFMIPGLLWIAAQMDRRANTLP